LLVEEIISQLPQQSPPKICADQSADLTVLVACGPYSSCEDLAYEGLKEIASLVKSQSFDLVVLIGPFVDDQHPILTSGNLVNSFDKLYKVQVKPILVDIEESAGHVCIIPSIRDVHHPPVFPQAPFDQSWHNNCTMLCNPSTFTFSNITIPIAY